jgi:hypothetical protein
MMSTTKELLNLALDALTYIHAETSTEEDELIDRAITALRAAIEQAEKQEPVAVVKVLPLGDGHKPMHWADWTNADNPPPEGTLLHTASPVQEPVSMRMPKVGDRVVCIEDESLGTIVYLTAGGSPEIKFDDGSHGTYMLREFAELFGYTTPPAAPVQEPVACGYDETTGNCTNNPCCYTTPPAAQPEPVQEPVKIVEYNCTCGKTMKFESVNGVVAAQRQWVGLTDEEIDDLAEFHGLDFMSYASFTRAIEAKLKELNT